MVDQTPRLALPAAPDEAAPAGTASADAGPGDIYQTETGYPEKSSGGMPQLDPEGSLFSSQIVWLIITFGFLYLMMARVVLPRITTIMEDRNEKISGDRDKAEEYRQQTEEAIRTYEAALAEARARAHRTVEETRKRAEAEREEHRKRSEAEIEARLKDAESRIMAMKDEALSNVREVATDVTGDLVGRLLSGKDVADTAISSAVDAELKAMPRL